MSDNDKKSEDKIDQAIDKGTGNLLVGAGVGTYGTAMFVTSGIVCPACVFVAPALLGIGAYQRHKYNKSQNNADDKTSETDN